MESDCRFNLGFRSRRNGSSLIRQSSFPWHFLRTENTRSVNATPWTFYYIYMFANDGGYMLFYALVKMVCGVTDIFRIARITFKIVNRRAGC